MHLKANKYQFNFYNTLDIFITIHISRKFELQTLTKKNNEYMF